MGGYVGRSPYTRPMGGQGGLYIAGTTVAWLLGCAWQLQQPVVRPWGWSAGLLVLSLALLLLAWQRRRVAWLAVLAALVAGFAASDWRAGLRLDDQLPPSLEGEDVLVTGVVASLPQLTPAGLQFRFEVDDARWRGQAVRLPGELALGWYKGWHDDGALSGPQTELRAGQSWRFTVRLRQPHGNLNPDGFDYELMMFEQGVRATGYVSGGDAALLDRQAAHPVERLRQRVRDAIQAHVADPRAAGVLAALAVGDQGAMLVSGNRVLPT